MVILRKIFLAGLLILSLGSCERIVDPVENADYGIPKYEISIDAEDYAQFTANVFTNYAVSADLGINGKTYNIKIEHQGYTSRGLLKKSYEVNYSSESDPILNSKKVILSAQATDPGFLRTLLACEVFKAAGLKTFTARPIFLYINDEPMGLYMLIEAINQEFFDSRDYPLGELFKAVNTKAQFSMSDGFILQDGFEKKLPDNNDYSSLESLISLLDNEPAKTFPLKLEAVFDVHNYLSYCAVTALIGNWDGIVHNFYLSKSRNSNIFEFIPWDLDRTFVSYSDRERNLNSNMLFDRIMSIEKYNRQYKDILINLSENVIPVSFCESKLEEFRDDISDAYKADQWFEANSYNLETEAAKIESFLGARNSYFNF